MSITPDETFLTASDGHRFPLLSRIPDDARMALLWLPALGVAARHYLPFADALAARGVAVFVHEWRGNGGSSLRAGRGHDWGYRELLERDLPLGDQTVQRHLPHVPCAIGGHSLGGQLAACYLGLHPHAFARLWLVASGSPHWRAFPGLRGLSLPWFYRFAIWLSHRRGFLPGRRLGFGGNEARSLIEDWARVGLSGRYAAAGLAADLEAGMAQAEIAIDAVLLRRDWLAPPASLRALLAKLPRADARVLTLDADALGAPADHFAWMRHPDAVADALLRPTLAAGDQ